MTNRVETEDWYFSEPSRQWINEPTKKIYHPMAFVWGAVMTKVYTPVWDTVSLNTRNVVRTARPR